jgi:hypothetical protein
VDVAMRGTVVPGEALKRRAQFSGRRCKAMLACSVSSPDEHVDAQVKLVPVDEQRVGNVAARGYVGVLKRWQRRLRLCRRLHQLDAAPLH